MNSYSNTAEKKYYQGSSIHAFQCGVIVRAVRSILSASTLGSLESSCLIFLTDLNLSGFFRIEVEGESVKRMFGHGVKRELMLKMRSCANCYDLCQKVLREDGFLSIKTGNTYFLVDTHSVHGDFVDILQDNLLLFVDSVQSWCNKHITHINVHQQHQTAKDQLSNKLRESIRGIVTANKQLIQNYHTISEDLLSNLIARFPSLALEADQEEMVLDIINQSISKQVDIIQGQIESNQDLCNLLTEAIESLSKDEVKEIQMASNDVESFGGPAIELF
ncbi:hypothetical protein [Teredinibacter sp. KSP-S5-2]|uniref:hypothetical protein n=1 Tax=Teredinibacter sp. KSP-S5-2 TaxID=3034506 RepID=UPI0029352C0F|nr:hypothetical protein [Teredinibacter sp. KSP-S5-2]WNO07616.1 hypothetical protein P5V12_11505 [Teredinibacter sp. KSP-S5-2]